MTYTLIRSARKTLGMQIKGTELIVRAPNSATKKEIDSFIERNRAWIEHHLERGRQQERAAEALGPLTEKELRELTERAKAYIPERVKLIAPIVGVTPGRVTIRCQRTKWGSCSSKGNLNFNCLLMLAPRATIDSVVVHELCHLKEMNHSKRFYAEVLRVFPEYKKHRQWLKTNGAMLMKRAAAGEASKKNED